MQYRVWKPNCGGRHAQPRARGKLADYGIGQRNLGVVRLGARCKDRDGECARVGRQMSGSAQRVISAARQAEQGGAAGYPVVAFIRLPIIAAFAAAVVLIIAALFATRFGMAIRALHDDEIAADLMGLHVRAIQVAAFTIGSILVGIGGGLYAHYFSFIEAQNFNIALSITVVLYVLLGGTQSVLGPLVGAAVFTLLPELLRGSQNWRYVVFAAALIVLMALRPQGLVTRVQLGRVFALRRAANGAAI